jgi:hypothetical protein
MRTSHKRTQKTIPPPGPAPGPAPGPVSGPASGPAVMVSNAIQSMVQGMALGAGSSVGHRAVDSIMSSNNGVSASIPRNVGEDNFPTTTSPFPENTSSLQRAKLASVSPTTTFDDPYLCTIQMENYVKCTHEQLNHRMCDKLYDTYLRCVSSRLESSGGELHSP